MNIPEGWPTDEMTQAGFSALPSGFNRIGYDTLRSVFKAMLKAAPTPPEVEDNLQRRVNDLEEQNGNLLNTREDLLQENYGLRRAAEELIDYLDTSRAAASWIMVDRLHEKLRGALNK